MADLIYIKNAGGGGVGGDATAANQTTQIGIESTIATNTGVIATNTGNRNVAVDFTVVTTNQTITAGFSSYTFINQGTQPATINVFLNLPVGSTFTVNLDRNEKCTTPFTIAFAALPGANVLVVTTN